MMELGNTMRCYWQMDLFSAEYRWRIKNGLAESIKGGLL